MQSFRLELNVLFCVNYQTFNSNIFCVLIDSVCDTMPCQNGGTCSVVAGTVSCSCVPGYSGYTCQGKHNQLEKHY